MSRLSDDHMRNPPVVSYGQWLLCVMIVAVVVYGCFTDDSSELVFVIDIICILNGMLVLNTAIEALKHGVLGKVLIMGTTAIMFWVEALYIAHQETPFAVSDVVAFPFSQFSADLIHSATLYVAVFQMMLLAGYSFRPRLQRFLVWTRCRVDDDSRMRPGLTYALALCPLIPLLVGYRFEPSSIVEALLAGRSGAGPAASDIGFLFYLYFFGIFGSALLLTEGLFRRARPQWVPVLVACLAALPFVLFWGARHLFLFVAVPPAIIGLRRMAERLTARGIMLALMGALFIGLVMQLQLLLRMTGFGQYQEVEATQLLKFDVTEQFNSLLFAVYLVPSTHEYFLEPAEPYFLIHWIPRAWWPDKPVPQSWSYYNDSYTQGRSFNVTPSIIGQFYINWGTLGVMWSGLLIGLLACLCDRIVLILELRRQLVMLVISGMAYAFVIASFRFYSPVYFIYVVAGVLGMFWLTRSSDIRELERKNAGEALRSSSVS